MFRQLGLIVLILLLSGVGGAQTLPPKGADESYVIVPTGDCDGGKVEVGIYKPALDEIWSRNPKVYRDICKVFVEKTFIARYRLAVRCVDPITLGPRSDWVRSLSGMGNPWPPGCPGFPPDQPMNPAVP